MDRRLAVIHLSDMHISEEDSREDLLKGAEAAFRAAQALFSPNAVCLVAITGDITWSGKPEQFDLATTFLDQVMARLSERHGEDKVALALVPGNHDVDFEKSSSVREHIIETAVPREKQDAAYRAALVEPLDAFVRFADSLGDRWKVVASSELQAVTELCLGEESIHLMLLNSAADSLLEEKYGRKAAIDIDPAAMQGLGKGCGLTIAMMHHPYTWYTWEASRRLRTTMEAVSDLILTGHEHDGQAYVKIAGKSDQSGFLEGGALRGKNGEDASSFNVAVVDLDRSVYSLSVIDWVEDGYQARDDPMRVAFVRRRRGLQGEFPFTEEFQGKLDDLGTRLNHPRKPDLVCADLFVWPDLEVTTVGSKEDERVVLYGDRLLEYVLREGRVLVLGDEKSGKSTLARQLVQSLHSAGKMGLLVSGEAVFPRKDVRRERAFDGWVRDAYGAELVERYRRLLSEERAVVVDDFERFCAGWDAKEEALAWLEDRFDYIVLIGGTEVLFDEIANPRRATRMLMTYQRLRMLEMGELGRRELIRKWRHLNIEYVDDERELHRSQVQSEREVTMLLGQSLFPSYPLYVLLILQQSELGRNAEMGSFGHLYEDLIKRSLVSIVRDSAELDVFLNYLSELAWELANQGERRLSALAFIDWHKAYCVEYAVEYDADSVLEKLVAVSVLEARNDEVGFRYRHVYNFFVAKRLASAIEQRESGEFVGGLCRSLHLRDSANVMIFLCHLTKHRMVIDCVLDAARSQFVGGPELNLAETPAFLAAKLYEPEYELEDGRPEEHHEEMLAEADDIARGRAGFGVPRVDDVVGPDVASELNSAQRTVQILGQLLRNYYGYMRGRLQEEILSECYSLGLRCLGRVFSVLEAIGPELGKYVGEYLKRSSPEVERREMVERVNRIIFGLSEGVAFSGVKLIATSVGMERLRPIARKCAAKVDNPSVRVVDLAVQLDFYRAFPQRGVFEVMDVVRKGVVGQNVVRHLVWEHFHVFHEDYRTKQHVCRKLGIAMPDDQFLNPKQKRLGNIR